MSNPSSHVSVAVIAREGTITLAHAYYANLSD